ncbi:MAG TPA: glycosyltransferase [Jiangellaceae bacterium]
MKIAHVVNLVDEIGSYGGPLRVAVNQLHELRDRGHDVVLLAGYRGDRSALGPGTYAGLPTIRFRTRSAARGNGFAGNLAWGLHGYLLRRVEQFDLVHIHLGRDLTSLPATATVRAHGVPYVVQPHGMIGPSGRRSAALLDTMLTRSALASARAVLLLTDAERGEVDAVLDGRAWTGVVLGNGVPGPPALRYYEDGGPPEVLFLSRLQERKRPLLFVEAARIALAAGVRARFTLVGPDEGLGPAVRDAIGVVRADRAGGDVEGKPVISYEGPAPLDGADRVSTARILVHPAVDEPFGMVLIEAMGAGLPVVCTRSCGLATAIEAAGAGMVVPDGDPGAIARAVERLVSDQELARRCGCAGVRLVRERFTARVVADRLEQVYHEAAAVPSPVAGLVRPRVTP